MSSCHFGVSHFITINILRDWIFIAKIQTFASTTRATDPVVQVDCASPCSSKISYIYIYMYIVVINYSQIEFVESGYVR